MISQKIKILIVDDEPRSRNILHTMITDYCNDVEIVGQANSVENAKALIDIKNPDLILLDIEMPFENGFALLEDTIKKNYEVVFISAYDHYAQNSIKYHALDYLLKPIDLDELENAIKKVKAIKYAKFKSLASNTQKYLNTNNISFKNKLSISTQNGKKLIPVDKILYCEADGPCTWVHMESGGKFYSSKNLGQIEKRLQAYSLSRFFSSHHRYLINLLRVRSFYLSQNLLELENGVEIVIAQRRKKNLRELLDSNP